MHGTVHINVHVTIHVTFHSWDIAERQIIDSWGKIWPQFDPSNPPVAHLGAEIEMDIRHTHVNTWKTHVTCQWPCQNVLTRVDTWQTRATCLGPCLLYSWRNSTPIWLLTLPCSSSGSRVRNGHVTDTCRHVKDTCHVSGTMSIGFLAKFYPNLTPHTPL